MAYLVDGHNLLGQTPGLSLGDPDDRRELMRRLAAFARARRCRIEVVFDGPPPQGWAASESLGALSARHAGPGRSADDALLETIRRAGAPGDITLVTSDKSLGDRARHLGARALAGHAFRKLMAAAERAGGGGEKPEAPDRDEVDYFLEAFGSASEPDERPAKRRR